MHARLMGAVRHKRTETSVLTDPPEPNAPEGFLLSSARLDQYARHLPGRETRIPGCSHRSSMREPEARGPPEGTARACSRSTDGGADERSALAARDMRERRDDNVFFPLHRIGRGFSRPHERWW